MDTAKASRNSYFSLTAGGSLLALRLRDRFGGTAHLPRCQTLGCGHCDPFDSISEALPERFEAGDTLICIMATGIVFRVLAPYLKSKQSDPAIIVLDEDGRHVIPLLGGHAAGANDLAREIAEFLGTKAAITTSSDVQGLVAPDVVAGKLDLQVADHVSLRKVTALVVDGKPVCIEAPCDPGIDGYGWVAPGASLEGCEGRLLVTHLAAHGQDEDNTNAGGITTARLIPRTVAVGAGCKRGETAAQITSAIEEACAQAGIDPRAVGALASVDAKRDEPGLREAAGRLGLLLRFYGAAELSALKRPGSSFVEEAVGTPAVAEPAALLAAGEDAELALSKTKFGPVTISLAVAGRQLEAPAPEKSGGMVMVIGTGAGTAAMLTAGAAEAIEAADTVFGYRTYIRQLEKIFPDKKYVAGSMGAETERCRQALDLAAAGEKVAMVSSGDPGVYGMAGPLLEMANGIPVSVIPGVTAAQLAAARLGAPLMNDYVTLSLSDLLTPREEVLRRAEAAAASDLVICLYNPTSRKRQPLFEEVCALLTAIRPVTTPVGWVRDAGGPEEEAAIIELGELAGQQIDMRTIVVVGNSRTEVINDRLVTRRGYRDVEA